MNEETLNDIILKLIKEGEIEIDIPLYEEPKKDESSWVPISGTVTWGNWISVPYKSILKYKITIKGLNRIYQEEKVEEKKIKAEFEEISNRELKNKLYLISSEIGKQSEKMKSYDRKFAFVEKKISSQYSDFKKTSEEIQDVRDDSKRIQSEFYGKIIEIFSIFVAIFAFIIVGFTQIPSIVDVEKIWYINLLNASSVFIPLLVCIIILLLFVNWIIKKTIWS